MTRIRTQIIAVDFDGTLCMHEFPEIGAEVPGAIRICQDLQQAGHRLILHTMRSGVALTTAVDWCRSKGVTFWGVNENPTQHTWTHSPKTYANIYIDDAALGCPLITNKHDRPFVNWHAVEHHLVTHGILPLPESYKPLPFFR